MTEVAIEVSTGVMTEEETVGIISDAMTVDLVAMTAAIVISDLAATTTNYNC
jgi:hypothetical protein